MSTSPLPPVETGVQVLEVSPPEGWRPSEDGSIDAFVDIEDLCARSPNDTRCSPAKDLGDQANNDKDGVDAPTGGPGNENPGDKDEPVVPMPDVPGVTKDDVETFVNFTLKLIEKSLEAKNETMTPENLITAAKGISTAILNAEVSPEAIQTVADMANGKLEGATMFVFLKGTAVNKNQLGFGDPGHTAFGVMSPEGSFYGSVNGTTTPNEFVEGVSTKGMMQWAQDNLYTRVYTKSLDYYDFDEAHKITIDQIDDRYFLWDNCAHATHDVLEALATDSPNEIPDYSLGSVPDPQIWAERDLVRGGFTEIPLFKSDGTVRSNDRVGVEQCQAVYKVGYTCSTQFPDPNEE